MTSSMDSPTAAQWTIVVALAQNGVIGRGGQLPWRLSSDLRRFKALTMGHCLLMGRKTYQSIGKPLPGRQTIVLSQRGFQCQYPEVKIARDLGEVEALVELGRQVMVVGGAELYRAALDHCNQLWLTRVLATVPGDTYFPLIDWTQWHQTECQSIPAGPSDEWPTEFQRWQRLV